MTLFEQFLPVILLLGSGTLFAILMLTVSKLTRAKGEPAEGKYDTYECGETPIGSSHIQFDYQYYIYAILFAVMDVITLFLASWMVFEYKLEFGVLAIVGGFLSVVTLGLAYALVSIRHWRYGII